MLIDETHQNAEDTFLACAISTKSAWTGTEEIKVGGIMLLHQRWYMAHDMSDQR